MYLGDMRGSVVVYPGSPELLGAVLALFPTWSLGPLGSFLKMNE